MKHPTRTNGLRLERFALMVALVVVLRLLAWDLHHALDFHADSGERCEVCVVMERGGDGVVAAAGKLPPPAQPPAPSACGSDPDFGVHAPCPPARGPPSLLG
jgi:hypothetical protein